MTLNEYQQLAARTCPDLGEKLNIAHMLLGLGSEYNELVDAVKNSDVVNIGEELTDKQWYLTNYCRMKGVPYDVLSLRRIPVPNPEYIDLDVAFEMHYYDALYAISKLCDAEKRFIAYNRPASEAEVLVYTAKIFSNLEVCYHIRGLDPDRCRENNINKLKVRYPDKFTEHAALNRDLDAERAELEK